MPAKWIEHLPAYEKNVFRYLMRRLLRERARLVKDAITAKNVAFRWGGALLAIHTSIGIIATCPRGDSSAVSTTAINRASTTPWVKPDVHSCSP